MAEAQETNDDLDPDQVDENLGENEPPAEPPPKEKQEECPPCEVGAPAWMATFADMATLLMAFFCTHSVFRQRQRAEIRAGSGIR